MRAARQTGALVTAEEHSIIGGLGGAVAEVVAECLPGAGKCAWACPTASPKPGRMLRSWIATACPVGAT